MQYVIVGAGPAGVIASETLRKVDPEGAVTIIGDEDAPPYSRMAIPYYLEGNIAEEGAFLRKSAAHYRELGIEVLRNKRVSTVDTGQKQVVLADGERIPYDRLLLCTGSSPETPPVPGLDSPGITPCWTLEQAREIKAQLQENAKVVLIGAGFIGTIIMDAIGSQQIDLTVVEAETHMTPRMMNRTGGDLMKKWCESKGVRMLTSTKVERVEHKGDHDYALQLDNGETIPANLVVTATGVKPNIAFLEGSGISTEEGILADENLRTNIADIFAAGDVAQGRDFSTGGLSVHAIQPTASEHGIVAAQNMAGKEAPYQGSLIMNVVATLGLMTYSFGNWMGVEGGQHGEALDEEKFRYLRLEFDDIQLTGAIQIGPFEHIGIFRGLIQNRIPLGEWKEILMADPHRIMEAYLALTDWGKNIPVMTPMAS